MTEHSQLFQCCKAKLWQLLEQESLLANNPSANASILFHHTDSLYSFCYYLLRDLYGWILITASLRVVTINPFKLFIHVYSTYSNWLIINLPKILHALHVSLGSSKKEVVPLFFLLTTVFLHQVCLMHLIDTSIIQLHQWSDLYPSFYKRVYLEVMKLQDRDDCTHKRMTKIWPWRSFGISVWCYVIVI